MEDNMQTIEELMRIAWEKNASDLHITVGSPPIFRIHGDLIPYGNEPITQENTEQITFSLLNNEKRERLNEIGEVDLSYGISGVSRFRINIFRQRGVYSLAIRLIPNKIPQLSELGLPETLLNFTEKAQGLVLVTGPTGSGKSTTLAALIDHINQTQKKHIITLEDPIEYLHRHQKSIIDQREIGSDSLTFANALRAALRQDPDVILVGEMRDLETIATAVTAAETGHLVFATLHTTDAAQTIDRIIDVFPPEQQGQIRLQLAAVLLGVVSQRLLPHKNGNSRVVAVEILVNTPAISNLIRTEKIHQIKSIMQTGRAQGMQTMEFSLQNLLSMGKINEFIAKQYLNTGIIN